MHIDGLATGSPCGIWGRVWTTCLLYDGPVLGLRFRWQLLCKSYRVKRNFPVFIHFLWKVLPINFPLNDFTPK